MIIGLTGGIGSGKTTVGRIMAVLGCAVFDSDLAAREAYGDTAVRKKVTALLGEKAYTPTGDVDRAYVSSRVFGDTTLLGALNAIIHPQVGVSFRNFIARHPGKTIVKESALLFEAGIAGQCDKVITVVSPDEIRLRRVMHRDGVSEEEVRSRMARQLPQYEKAERSDYTVVNDDVQLVIPQVIAICRELIS